jgi:hypothetical protein
MPVDQQVRVLNTASAGIGIGPVLQKGRSFEGERWDACAGKGLPCPLGRLKDQGGVEGRHKIFGLEPFPPGVMVTHWVIRSQIPILRAPKADQTVVAQQLHGTIPISGLTRKIQRTATRKHISQESNRRITFAHGTLVQRIGVGFVTFPKLQAGGYPSSLKSTR